MVAKYFKSGSAFFSRALNKSGSLEISQPDNEKELVKAISSRVFIIYGHLDIITFYKNWTGIYLKCTSFTADYLW